MLTRHDKPLPLLNHIEAVLDDMFNAFTETEAYQKYKEYYDEDFKNAMNELDFLKDKIQ